MIIGICFVFLEHAHSEIYQWKDDKGVVHFGDRPMAAAQDTESPENEAPDVDMPMEDISVPASIKLKLRGLLRQQNFSELNRILDNYQKASESDIANEDRLFTAYAGFKINDRSYGNLLDKWVAATPDKYMPYLARACYYCNMAWESRGTKWASETKEEQFERMHAYFKKATKDIENCLTINDKCMVPYYLAIELAAGLGRDDDARAVAKKALKIRPETYRVRSVYLWALTPRWGGSFDMMKQFIEKSQAYVSQNPKLALLKGEIYAEAGDLQSINRKHSVAEKLYNKALSFGEAHWYLQDRGKSRYRQEDYTGALNDFNRAIELAPERGNYYYWRSLTYCKLKQYEKARSDIERADRLDPNDEDIQQHSEHIAYQLSRQGYELQKKVSPDKATGKYTSALRVDPENAGLYYRRARAYVQQSNLAMALEDIKKSIELDPHNINAYLLIDYILAKSGDWNQIIRYWDQYIELHPDNGRAYSERGGAYYHKGDIRSAVENAKIAADLGNIEGKEAYEKFKHLVK